MKKTAIFIAAVTLAASAFIAESATAQTLRKSKGDIYAEYVTPTYTQLHNVASTYYGMCSGRIRHDGNELIATSNALSTCELAYYYACKAYEAAPTRDEIIRDEEANGSNYESSSGGSGTPGSYTAERVGYEAHQARLAAARRTRETPSDTKYLTRPAVYGMNIQTDAHGVIRYTYAKATKPEHEGYRSISSLPAPGVNPYMALVVKKKGPASTQRSSSTRTGSSCTRTSSRQRSRRNRRA